MKIIDHIGIFENAMSIEMCEEYIKWFEFTLNKKLMNFGLSPQDYALLPEESRDEAGEDKVELSLGDKQFKSGKTGRSDIALYLNILDEGLADVCYEHLQKAFEEYSKEYPDLTSTTLISSEVKMQRTPPGGGYHIWHSERIGASQGFNSRHVTWMIYLNDMPDGEAETEFFHQKLRVKPTAGTIVLWPAAYTHIHRGNTVFTKNKYILTGWFRSIYSRFNE